MFIHNSIYKVDFSLKMAEVEMNEDVILVDGSHGEGGGQIIRNSVTLACILRRSIKVIKIRANRPNPGLASQHLESLLALLRLSGATTPSGIPKKQDVAFDLDGTTVPPFTSQSLGVNTTIDLKTAGSCTLCIQCILPFLMALKSPSRIKVIGGSHVMKSPSFDYFQRVFIPTFNNIIMENNVQAKLVRPGYYPRGGGIVELEVSPPSQGRFLPFSLMERGKLNTIDAILNVTPQMERDIPQFKKKISEHTTNIEVRTVSYASVEYFLYFEKSIAGFSHLVEGRNPRTNQLFEAISLVQKKLNDFLASSAVVDEYLQDQLVIYMALSKLSDPASQSRMKTVTPSDHTTSAIHVAQLFSPQHQFQIIKCDDGAHEIIL